MHIYPNIGTGDVTPPQSRSRVSATKLVPQIGATLQDADTDTDSSGDGTTNNPSPGVKIKRTKSQKYSARQATRRKQQV